jgi:hypothetical protein
MQKLPTKNITKIKISGLEELDVLLAIFRLLQEHGNPS